MSKVNLICFSDRNTKSGNLTTANRWESAIRGLGYSVRVSSADDIQLEPSDIAFFFNAKRFAWFQTETKFEPQGKIVLVLSGTDVYGTEFSQSQVQSAIGNADAVVVYEELAQKKLNAEILKKVFVVPHSAIGSNVAPHDFGAGMHVIMVSHIREEKNLLMAADVFQQLGPESALQLHHVGGDLDPILAKKLHGAAELNKRFTLHGEMSYEKTMAMIKGADLLLHPSKVEGAPNVIAESIVNGTPVFASNISAHQGMLGLDFPLYFDLAKPNDMLDQLVRFESEPDTREQLSIHNDGLRKRFGKEVETEALSALLNVLHRSAE